jgi:hypothetical protein
MYCMVASTFVLMKPCARTCLLVLAAGVAVGQCAHKQIIDGDCASLQFTHIPKPCPNALLHSKYQKAVVLLPLYVRNFGKTMANSSVDMIKYQQHEGRWELTSKPSPNSEAVLLAYGSNGSAHDGGRWHVVKDEKNTGDPGNFVIHNGLELVCADDAAEITDNSTDSEGGGGSDAAEHTDNSDAAENTDNSTESEYGEVVDFWNVHAVVLFPVCVGVGSAILGCLCTLCFCKRRNAHVGTLSTLQGRASKETPRTANIFTSDNPPASPTHSSPQKPQANGAQRLTSSRRKDDPTDPSWQISPAL